MFPHPIVAMGDRLIPVLSAPTLIRLSEGGGACACLVIDIPMAANLETRQPSFIRVRNGFLLQCRNDRSGGSALMEQDDDDSTTVVDVEGDVVLTIVAADASRVQLRYLVSTAKLKAASPYFRTLLDPSKFSEGRMLAERLNGSQLQSNEADSIEKVPTITILDIALPLKPSHREVLNVFFRCIHEPDATRTLDKWTFSNVYLLTAIADRFMARHVLRHALQSVRHSGRHSPKGHRKSGGDIAERLCRQKLMVGVWYDFDEWVSFFSWRLIIYGSRKWLEGGDDIPGDDTDDPELPEGLEDELECRRACVLESLANVQDTLVGRYLGKERVCRSGLDSALQCDMFQLGQALRFLDRKQLVSLKSSIIGQDATIPRPESVLKICAALMECPSYQIDSFHQNCGLRTRLIRCVELMQQLVSTDAYVGICLECWRGPGRAYRWSGPAPGTQKWESGQPENGARQKHSEHGSQIVDLFTKGSLVESWESGWRPHNWQFRWMYDPKKTTSSALAPDNK